MEKLAVLYSNIFTDIIKFMVIAYTMYIIAKKKDVLDTYNSVEAEEYIIKKLHFISIVLVVYSSLIKLL